MTIVTKPLTEKKQEPLKKPLVAAGEIQNGEVQLDMDGAGDPHYAIPPRGHRVSTGTIFCLFLTSLLVLGVGAIGGLFLYRQFGHSPAHRVKGWLQIPRVTDAMLDPEKMIQTYEEQQRSNANMMEEFDIDLESDYENIYVPDFGNGRRGRFIHDFNANKTGIVDMDSRRCFVMPLNRARVLPPQSMFDLITKIWQGYYEVDTQVIRETYRVEFPPISSSDEMGKFIFRECDGLPTYRLKRIDETISKRSISDTVVYNEFAGKNIAQFKIIADGISQYEKEHKV